MNTPKQYTVPKLAACLTALFIVVARISEAPSDGGIGTIIYMSLGVTCAVAIASAALYVTIKGFARRMTEKAQALKQ